jgi:glycerol-3-phosphate dehydrogenase
VTDKTLAFLGKTRTADTKSIQIGGGKGYPLVGLAQVAFIKRVADETGLGELKPKKLFERYGTRAMEIAQYIKAKQDAPLKSKPDWSRREVEFLIEWEKAVHVDDILLRRSTLAWLGDVTRPLVEELAGIMGDSLGWSEEQKKAELTRTLDLLKDRHGVEL